MRSDGFHAEALAAAGDAHHEQSLGHDLRAQRVAHLEKLAAFQQPLLEIVQAAHLADGRASGDVFDDAAAADQSALFLKQERNGFGSQTRAAHLCPPERIAGFVESEPLQRPRELLPQPLIGVDAFIVQKLRQLDDIGRAQLNVQKAAVQFLRDGAHRRADHDELPLIQTVRVQVAQAAANLSRIAQRLVKIL
jgi:hypothetical protein